MNHYWTSILDLTGAKLMTYNNKCNGKHRSFEDILKCPDCLIKTECKHIFKVNPFKREKKCIKCDFIIKDDGLLIN